MLKNRTYLPSGKRTPRLGGVCMAKNGALKVVSSRIELPEGRFKVRLGWRGCGSANSSVTDAAKNRSNTATFLILICVFSCFYFSLFFSGISGAKFSNISINVQKANCCWPMSVGFDVLVLVVRTSLSLAVYPAERGPGEL